MQNESAFLINFIRILRSYIQNNYKNLCCLACFYYFCNMNVKMNHIIALVLLGCFIPAIIGFSFIHHHCSGCESNKTEALLSIIHHQHEHDDCFCSASVAEHCNDNQEQSCTCHDANDSKHQHNCFVDLKRLDIPDRKSVV